MRASPWCLNAPKLSPRPGRVVVPLEDEPHGGKITEAVKSQIFAWRKDLWSIREIVEMLGSLGVVTSDSAIVRLCNDAGYHVSASQARRRLENKRREH